MQRILKVCSIESLNDGSYYLLGKYEDSIRLRADQ